MKIYDIVVIGGGPAGSSFLINLGPEYNTLLIDNASNNKVCGGLISPDARKSLARMGVTIPKKILVSPQIYSVRVIDLNVRKTANYEKSYVNMDRDKFDKHLKSLVKGDKVDARAYKIKKNNDLYEVSYKDRDNKKTTVLTKYIVGADGASSFTRKHFDIDLDTREYTSIQKWYDEKENNISPFLSAIFDSKTSDCCSWTISKDGKIIFGGAFEKKGAIDAFEKQRKKLRRFGVSLNNEFKTEACTVLRPKNMNSFCSGTENVFLVGEAAGLISPSSLEGISFALDSGRMLAESFEKNDIRMSYDSKLLKLKFKSLSKLVKGVFMYTPKLRRAIIKNNFLGI